MISKQQVLSDLDPHYFLDYACLTGVFRYYVAKTLVDTFLSEKSEPQQKHCRLCILGVFKEEYAAYEDIGAFIKAFLKWVNKVSEYPLDIVLTYRPKDVVLSKVFKKEEIFSSNDLYKKLKLSDWIPKTWNSTFPEINIEKILYKLCNFIYVDCTTNQKEYGKMGYNKIKHGLCFIPDARKYGNYPNAPAMIFENDNDQEVPIILYAIKMDDDIIKGRLKSIEFVQYSLRILAAMYVVYRYPDFLKRIGFDPPELLFKGTNLKSIRRVMKEISSKSD